ncbi:MAG: hypothetical protein P8P83_05135 [Rickettsiaceae bacterium]|nr:hypothetical protein [Rickettsiaceae bacterium]
MPPTKKFKSTQTDELTPTSIINAKCITISQRAVETKPILDDEYINLLFDMILYKQELHEHFTEARTSGNCDNLMDFLGDTF